MKKHIELKYLNLKSSLYELRTIAKMKRYDGQLDEIRNLSQKVEHNLGYLTEELNKPFIKRFFRRGL